MRRGRCAGTFGRGRQRLLCNHTRKIAISPTGRVQLLSNSSADPAKVDRIIQLLGSFRSGSFGRLRPWAKGYQWRL